MTWTPPSAAQICVLLAVAVLGHLTALLWWHAGARRWSLCQVTIYNLPVKDSQIRRELKNSVHTPIHAVMLGACVLAGFFRNDTLASFAATAVATTLWAEIWHYWSHRAFHLKRLHWIHVEHHKSAINTPFTAISFSFSEKLIFNIGLLLPFLIADRFVSVNFYGIAGWYAGYLIVNSFSHANFEFRGAGYPAHLGRVLTTTTYHALHHSRYTGNYGLGSRVLDRVNRTEWEDYEPLYDRIARERRPLSALREKVARGPAPAERKGPGGTEGPRPRPRARP